MLALLFSILSSTLIFIVFKLFDRFQINTLQAIVVNYCVACCCGILFYKNDVVPQFVIEKPWFIYALLLGSFFILIFNLMAWTTQRSGLSVVSVATKMSVVIPIVFGLLYYKESVDALKLIGILLALIAVYLASVKQKGGTLRNFNNLILPILVFLGSGIIDTSLKFLEDAFVPGEEVSLFSATIFGAAASVGIAIVSLQLIQRKNRLAWKNLLGGIALGIPNYFSVYFLVQALKSDVLESSGLFTVNNVAIVMFSTAVGILLFSEKLTTKNWWGISLAILSIILVTWGKL